MCLPSLRLALTIRSINPRTASTAALLLLTLAAAVPSTVVFAGALERSSPTRQTQRGAMTEVDGGDPGESISCTDVRTGSPFQFQAQRLLASGVIDTSWTPDSSQVCVGSAEGLAQRLIPDGSGGAFVAWVDQREGYPDVRLGRLDPSGSVTVGWSAERITLSPFRASRDHVTACSDGATSVPLNRLARHERTELPC